MNSPLLRVDGCGVWIGRHLWMRVRWLDQKELIALVLEINKQAMEWRKE